MKQNINELTITRRLRMLENVIRAGKDAPEIINILQEMGIPHWDIGRILVGETLGWDDTLKNPADGKAHYIRHCIINLERHEDDYRYYVKIDGLSVEDFFANVISKEYVLMAPDKLYAENLYLRKLHNKALAEIKELNKKISYLEEFNDRYGFPHYLRCQARKKKKE